MAFVNQMMYFLTAHCDAAEFCCRVARCHAILRVMPEKLAIFDEALSFYRYLVVSPRDRDWGLFVTGAGHEVMTVTSAAAAHRKRYRYLVTTSDDKYSVSWDPDYPQPYRYDWQKGRTLVDEYALLYIDGGASWIFESESMPGSVQVKAGSVVLLFPGVWHRYRPKFDEADQFSSTLWCTFGGDIAKRWQQRELISAAQPVLYVGADLGLETSFRRLHGHVQSREAGCLQPRLAGTLFEIMGHAEAATRSTAPALSSDLIHHAKTVLEDLTAPEASPQDVSRILNLPYNQFRRSFKLAIGVSPHQYRLQMIIRRAKELLEGTDMTMKQIARTLHFADQYYFAKAFKRKTGVTPTNWRVRSRRRAPTCES